MVISGYYYAQHPLITGAALAPIYSETFSGTGTAWQAVKATDAAGLVSIYETPLLTSS